MINQNVRIQYRQTNPIGLFRRYNVTVSQFGEWNYGGDFTHGSLQASASWTFRNLYGGSISLSRVDQALQVRDLRGGPMMLGDKYWNLRMALNSDSRKTFYAYASYVRRRNDHGGSLRDDWSGSLRWRVTNALNVSCRLRKNWIVNDMQFVKTRDFNGEERYILGHLEQDVLSASFRVNWSLTPDLTIQYYGQPFVSAGRYSGLRYVSRPRAENYNNRFQQYSDAQVSASCSCGDIYFDEDLDGVTDYSFTRPDFNVKEFLSNLVIRWEYKPGSAFYLVWSQSRNDRINDGTFSSGEDLDYLFTVPPHNIFLAKMSYWFSY